MEETNYTEINRNSWNNRVDAHLQSEFYDLKGFKEGKSSLKEIERALLGDIKGKSILHLQCHFGQDSISLARMGASVTGVDLSDKSIAVAKALNDELGTTAEFICCNIYDLPAHLTKSFDYVFTSYGTIGWLPDLDKWAGIIAQYLKPGGQFIFAEFHPIVWMFDDAFKDIAYTYHNSGALLEYETGTYANKEAEIAQSYVMWNHGMAEVIQALIQAGLHLTDIQEYTYSPWNCFQHTVEIAPNKFQIQHLGDKIPMVYSLVARK